MHDGWCGCKELDACNWIRQLRTATCHALETAEIEVTRIATTYAGTEKWCIGLRDVVDAVAALRAVARGAARRPNVGGVL
jgi:hypothetical protein